MEKGTERLKGTEDWEDCLEKVVSGCDMGAVLMSQQLWLPTQDLQRTIAVSVPAQKDKGLTGPCF